MIKNNKKLLRSLIIIVIVAVIVVIFAFLPEGKNFDAGKDTFDQIGTHTSHQHGFSFDYPTKYRLTESPNGTVFITSTAWEEPNLEECNALEDEQARSYCLNPGRELSPNIIIRFLEGDPDKLWDEIQFYQEGRNTYIANGNKWEYFNYGGEFGGTYSYGLKTPDGLYLASFSHIDIGGGTPFEALESTKYQLSHEQQNDLLESILNTFEIEQE